MGSLLFFTQLVLALAVVRLAEFAVSRATTERARQHGATELGRREFPLVVGTWVLLYLGTLIEVWTLRPTFHPRLAAVMVAAVLLSEGLRWWSIATLGRRWSNRIVLIPGAAPIRTGPYRLMRHPADLAALVIGMALPLVHSAWITALTVTLVNGVLLTMRAGIEDDIHKQSPLPRKALV